MLIGVDIRSLINPRLGGVPEYTYRLLENILFLDQKNEYILFSNSYRKNEPVKFNSPQIIISKFSYPNKLFNLSLKLFKKPKIDQLISKKKIDLFFMPNLGLAPLSCKKIITVHDLSFKHYPEFYSLKSRLWHTMINPKKLCQEAEKLIAVSENTKNDLMDLYKIKGEKIEVIYPGIFLEKKERKNNFSFPYLLSLSLLEPRKNIEGLIHAFQLFKRKYSLNKDYKLVIAGSEGWKYKNIYKLSNKDVIFLNYVSPEDKYSLFKNASLFLYPSFYEGFGFPPLEAMSCSVPVIASHTSSLSEVLGKAALTVDPYNLNELSQAIYLILTDQQLRENLIQKGLKEVEKYNWKEAAKKTLSLFKSFDHA